MALNEGAKRMHQMLPDYYAKSRYIEQLYQAVSEETENHIEKALNDERRNFSPSTADTHIERWEKIVGESPTDDMNIEQRRQKILSKLQPPATATVAQVQRIASNILGTDVVAAEKIPLYTVELQYPQGSGNGRTAAAIKAVREILPAHLSLSVTALTVTKAYVGIAYIKRTKYIFEVIR